MSPQLLFLLFAILKPIYNKTTRTFRNSHWRTAPQILGCAWKVKTNQNITLPPSSFKSDKVDESRNLTAVYDLSGKPGKLQNLVRMDKQNYKLYVDISSIKTFSLQDGLGCSCKFCNIIRASMEKSNNKCLSDTTGHTQGHKLMN